MLTHNNNNNNDDNNNNNNLLLIDGGFSWGHYTRPNYSTDRLDIWHIGVICAIIVDGNIIFSQKDRF